MVKKTTVRKKSTKAWFKKTKATVSERMRRVKSVGTKLEESMERILKANKIRFVRQPGLFGKPDFLIKGTKLLVFCDSSFWHGRRKEELSGEAFRKNKDFWVCKLNYNRRRDASISRNLRRQGWSVYRFWDTDVLRYPERVAQRLIRGIGKNGKK